MTRYPVAELFSLRLSDGGQCRFTVRCPHCHTLHGHRWDGRHVAFDLIAPCSTDHDVRMYRVDLVAALDRDSNAMHEYENNWIE